MHVLCEYALTGIWLFLAFFGENRLATMLLIIRAEVSRLIVALTEAD